MLLASVQSGRETDARTVKADNGQAKEDCDDGTRHDHVLPDRGPKRKTPSDNVARSILTATYTRKLSK